MHYPGGTGAAKPLIGHRKTVLGTKTDPNKSFQKNTKPSSTDVARTNAMYATEANQKRDVGKDCRSGVRLTRTYTVPAALTSTLTVTDAPIDITGTPIISSGPADGQAEATMTGGAAATSGLAAQPLTSCRLVQYVLTLISHGTMLTCFPKNYRHRHHRSWPSDILHLWRRHGRY